MAPGCASDSGGTNGAAGKGGGAGNAAAGRGGSGTGGAGAGTAGATGTAGITGAAGTGGTMADVGLGFSDRSASVLTRNKHETRDGNYIQPTFTFDAAGGMKGDQAFVATFSGDVQGSPLYMEDGPAGKGAFFIATTSNDVYALDETTGAVVWQHNIGPAPGVTGVGCGSIAPVGIISTPVIDAASRTIFVAGGVGDAATIMHHEVHALNVDTGAERLGWPVDVSTLTAPGGITFNTPAQNQRGALSLVNGILYVPYGGHAGDCNRYRGWVEAIKIADPTQTAAWATGGIGEGIWATGGLASTGDGVLAITGTTWTPPRFTSTARRSSTSGAWHRSIARPASSSRAAGTTWTPRTWTSGRAVVSSSVSRGRHRPSSWRPWPRVVSSSCWTPRISAAWTAT